MNSGVVKLTYVTDAIPVTYGTPAFARLWDEDPYAVKRTGAIEFLKSKGIWDVKHNAPHPRIR